MTVVAGRIGLNMVNRFTSRRITVMTAGTGTGNHCVIKIDRQPVVG